LYFISSEHGVFFKYWSLEIKCLESRIASFHKLASLWSRCVNFIHI